MCYAPVESRALLRYYNWIGAGCASARRKRSELMTLFMPSSGEQLHRRAAQQHVHSAAVHPESK